MVDSFKLEKLNKLIAEGIEPYPYSYHVTHHAIDIAGGFEHLVGKDASIAGRILRLRSMGSLHFLDLHDSTGKIQVLVKADSAEAKSMKLLDLCDIGDIVGIKGTIMKTKRGEISVDAREVVMLAKSLLTLPEKFHGLKDTELRYRKRYLDLIINPEVKDFFSKRAAILAHVRNFLDKRRYVEFETPVLQPVYGGGFARPFKTHYNAIDSEVYLRIADELYLKKLIIGGFERVYEVSKDFRNEDIDSTHNPEFTQVELYEAYKDYNDYMKLAEELISGIVKEMFGTYKVNYQDNVLDFEPPFKRFYWVEEIKKRIGVDISEIDDAQAAELAEKEHLNIPIKNAYHVADALFDKHIKTELFQPTFVLDFPAYMCPLTKAKRGNPKLSERFELYIAGYEEGNCYSELTNPIEQREKFSQQDRERKKGDSEVPPVDTDFLEAIEYGMPPTAGLGLSIDRLAMILTNNTSIKEIIAFPAVRPEKKLHEEEKDGKE